MLVVEESEDENVKWPLDIYPIEKPMCRIKYAVVKTSRFAGPFC